MESRFFRLKRIRAQIRKFAPVLFLVMAFFLILLGRSQHPWLSFLRTTSVDLARPVFSILSSPIKAIKVGIEGTKNLIFTYSDNQQLKKENEDLKLKLLLFEQLNLENQQLKKQWNYISLPVLSVISSPVLADEGTSYVKTILVPVGEKEGIKKGSVVLAFQGVVGRVLEVGKRFSRVLLITDYLSRIPVMVGEKRVLAIATGENSPLLKLTSLPEGAVVKEGDEVITSGYAGVFPAGLGIGIIKKIDDKGIFIQPYVLKEELEIIQIVDFGLSGLLTEESDCQKD